MAGLSRTQLERFQREGYLVVEDLLNPRRDLDPVLDEYSMALDALAEQLHRDGSIGSPYRDLPFEARLIQVCRESGRTYSQYFDFSLPQKGVRPNTPIHVGPAVFRLLTHPSVLDVAESVVGPEVYSNPVQHIRMKLPATARPQGTYDGLVQPVPWHQDNGVILPEADESGILTVWLPLTEATEESGCLEVIPRSHGGELLAHCPTDHGVGIPAKLLELERAVPLPMHPGSLLLMTQRTVHASLDNTTADRVRVSLDLRYQPLGQPTGRPMFPGFVARSRAHPESELRDPDTWAHLWYAARAALAASENPSFNRWRLDAPVCA